jgi:hypothetical protein
MREMCGQGAGGVASNKVTPMAWVGIILTIALGVYFYVVRCRWQLVYGAIEILAALVIIFVTFYPQTNYLLLAESSWQGWLLRKGVGALAGMYVMVRGLDNIEKGLPLRWHGGWKRLFYGKPE